MKNTHQKKLKVNTLGKHVTQQPNDKQEVKPALEELDKLPKEQISVQAIKRLGLDFRYGHLDSTSFPTSGQYNSKSEPEKGVIHIDSRL